MPDERETVWRIVEPGHAVRSQVVGDLEVTAGADLRLRLRRARIDGIRVDALAATAHSAGWAGPAVPGGVILVLLVAGRATTTSGAEILPGSLVAAMPGPQFAYRACEPIHAVAVVLLPPVAPPHLSRFPMPVVVAPEHHNRVVAAFAALLQPIAAGPMPAGGAANMLGQGLADLAFAVLAEMAPGRAGDGQDAMRFRAHEYIEQHLTDAALDPSAVAAAVGVSPRSLQALFHGEGTSVARSIRERRLDLAALSLRDEPVAPGTAALAARMGFAGPDQFTRAFRARFGRPPCSYRAEQRSA